MKALEDRTAAVRTGQELNLKSLERYLSGELNLSGDLSVEQFPSGYSNLTYLITAGEERFVLRCPPPGTKAKSANDMDREFTVLGALNGYYTYAPKIILQCKDNSVIGTPFYLMEYIQGFIVRTDYPDVLATNSRFVAAQCRQFVAAMAELHAIDYHQAGLAGLGNPEGYTARQISGWFKRFTAALTSGTSSFQVIIEWLDRNLPRNCEQYSLIHNDYKMDNIIWDIGQPEAIIGVLDWEMTTLGDPLMDLGATLGYWIEATDPEDMQAIRNMPSNIPGALTRKELIASYAAASGRGISTDSFNFYYVYGLFRRAAICQQIYYRFRLGQTSDQRFAKLPKSVSALEAQAKRVIFGEI
jgi:aminoglycoside phosphotransferase (APT) family kinase protein